MIDKGSLTEFILMARTKTYAGDIGKVPSLVPGSTQYEYQEGDLLYRDIYNVGLAKFAGLETVYYGGSPIWTMSYYGNFAKMAEADMDRILRKALIENWSKTRLWSSFTYSMGEYVYAIDASGTIDEMEGEETIERNGSCVYFFYYSGGLIAEI